MKKFIFTIAPQQKLFSEVPKLYTAVDNQDLSFDFPSVFPIFSLINAYAERNEKITLVPILMGIDNTENNYTKLNYERFLGEFDISKEQIFIKDRATKTEEEIQAELNEAISLIKNDNIKYHMENTWRDLNLKIECKPIEIPFSGSIETMHDLYIKIIESIDDGDILYGDVSYGNKIVSIVQSYAFNASYRLRKNTRIESIVYGEYNFKTQVKNLYDITSYTYLDELVMQLSEIPYDDPLGELRRKVIIPDFES